jgi:hypothetical protein
VGDNQSATIGTTVDCMGGELSFWHAVDSKQDFDYLYFYVDDTLQAAWSGSIAYTRASFPVSSGIHSFKWVYAKDASISAGSDVAWLDDIFIPVPGFWIRIWTASRMTGMGAGYLVTIPALEALRRNVMTTARQRTTRTRRIQMGMGSGTRVMTSCPCQQARKRSPILPLFCL